MSWPSDDADTLIVGVVGGYAADRLQRARQGRVRAVFERSAYIELGGQWICIGGQRLGCGPLNALVSSADAIRHALATLVQDRPVRGAWPRFRTDHAVLDFTQAVRWHPTLPRLSIERARLARGVTRTRDAARARIPRAGLAFVVSGATETGALADAGRLAAAALRAFVLARGSGSPPDALRRLLGLGPGLTPSGDDFLGGALVALHAFGEQAIARAIGEWLLPLSQRATHPISVAHLEAAAHGEGSEALHACLVALADDRDPDSALDAIAAVGHTSGWDALAGAMSVASAIGDA